MGSADSSVWIDYFNGVPVAECDLLDALLGREFVLIGDLILTEVLQGFRTRPDTARLGLSLSRSASVVSGGGKSLSRRPKIVVTCAPEGSRYAKPSTSSSQATASCTGSSCSTPIVISTSWSNTLG